MGSLRSLSRKKKVFQGEVRLRVVETTWWRGETIGDLDDLKSSFSLACEVVEDSIILSLFYNYTTNLRYRVCDKRSSLILTTSHNKNIVVIGMEVGKIDYMTGQIDLFFPGKDLYVPLSDSMIVKFLYY
jgi:hypothetical protein